MSDDTGKPRLLLGLTPLAERQVEEQLFRADRLGVIGSAANSAELLALAERQRPDAVLCSAEFPGLDAGVCARLRASGLRLLGLALDERSAQTLETLGVEALLHPPLDPEALTDACTDQTAAPTAAECDPLGGAPPLQRSERTSSGSLLAVVPAAGSPGASECACSLAALAERRWPTLLVELDLLGGGLDLRLGADSQQGSLLALARATASGEPLSDLLERWTVRKNGWPAVLLAPPDLDAHIGELARPGVVPAALEAACAAYPLVIVDVGSLLATPGELPQAARCHRDALLAADAVLLVLGAREQQLRAGRAQLARLLELGIKRERIRITVNGLGAPDVARKHDLATALNDELAPLKLAVDAWLPHDARATKRARRSGLPLALARPHGRYARALRALLGELLLPTQPVPRERKLRLPVPNTTTARSRSVAAGTSAAAVASLDEEVQLPWRS